MADEIKVVLQSWSDILEIVRREETERWERMTAEKTVVYDADQRTVTLAGYYEIDLTQITTPNVLLSWIWHLRAKVWGARVLDDFLFVFEHAFEERFGVSPPSHDSRWDWEQGKIK